MTVLRVDVAVRSSDIDDDGIMNNAVYFNFQQEGRMAMLLELGLARVAKPDGSPPERVWTVAETGCRFLQPVYWPAKMVIEARVTEVRARSFRFEYRLVVVPSGEALSEGYSAQVWIDTAGRPTPMPDDVRARLEAALVPSVASRPW